MAPRCGPVDAWWRRLVDPVLCRGPVGGGNWVASRRASSAVGVGCFNLSSYRTYGVVNSLKDRNGVTNFAFFLLCVLG